MKYFLFFFLFAGARSAYAQLEVRIQWENSASGDAGDSIYYDSNRKLEWDDFQGKPDQRSIAAAVTSSGFGYSESMHSRNGKGILYITVNCFYNKSRSWVKQGMRSDYALVHEQHHFDITYLWACRFMAKLKAANFSDNNYNEVAERIYDECFHGLENNQNEYDGETRNGRIKSEQESWNRKIDGQLAAGVTNSR